MSGILLPFPRVRDQGFIQRHARVLADASSTLKAEAYLGRQLSIQRETMRRRGFAPEVITAELAAIEAHIRAQAWRLALAPGGAA